MFVEREVCAEHGLVCHVRRSDAPVDVQKKRWEAAREVRQEALRHWAKMPFHVVREVLVVVFLHHARWMSAQLYITRKTRTHLIPERTQEILHTLPIVLAELAQVLHEHAIEP